MSVAGISSVFTSMYNSPTQWQQEAKTMVKDQFGTDTQDAKTFVKDQIAADLQDAQTHVKDQVAADMQDALEGVAGQLQQSIAGQTTEGVR